MTLAAGPLTEQDFILIRQAAFRRRAIAATVRVASASSAVTLIIAVLAAPFVAFDPSWQAALVVLGLGAIGVVEHVGGKRMRKADPSAPRLLAWNQLALLLLIVAYCAAQIATYSAGGMGAMVSPESRDALRGMSGTGGLDQLEAWVRLGVWAFYGLVAILSVGFQGGMAAYYFTRRKHVVAYLAQTPPWIQRVFTETGT